MSRRSQTSPPSAPSATGGHPAETGLPARARRLFISAAGVAILWGAGLLLLAVTTANPVTLNRAQIEQADDVVTATIEDPATGTILVSKAWKQKAPPGRLTVEPLHGRWARPGTAVLVPLAGDAGDRWHIARARLPAIIVVRKGATIAAAGRIVEGEALLQSSSAAGEGNSPVRRSAGDRVDAGMIVVDGALRISTSRNGPPLIYPATDETRDQLRNIFAGKP